MALKLLPLEKVRNDIYVTEGRVRCQFLFRSSNHLLGSVFSLLHYSQNVVAIVCDEVHTVVHW